ncbi:MAG: M28 family peptidase [Hymenobacter sp.]
MRPGITSAEPLGSYSTVIVLSAQPAGAAPSYRVSATTTLKTMQLRNVAGLLPGQDSKRVKEYVIFSGHYDHLGILKPVAGDSIANGADDDAQRHRGRRWPWPNISKAKDECPAPAFRGFRGRGR